MLCDYHVHTAYSDDSLYPMEEVVKDAISLGLEEICFTDHVDYGIKRDHNDPRGILYRPGGPGEPEWMPVTNVDYPRYVGEIRHLQNTYRDQITIRLGLEFGAQTHTLPEYRALFQKYPFDFIILSVHQIENKELWNQDFQKGRSQADCHRRYYEELLALVQGYQDYSVLGHMDLVSRYDRFGSYPFENVRPIVAEILKTVIESGRGIELNTSSHRYGLRELTPCRDILKLYRELGGTIITIGSDSHKREHLGAWISDAQKALKALGFSWHCTFDRMQPVYHPL